MVVLARLDAAVLLERSFCFQFDEKPAESSARFQDQKVRALESVFLDCLVSGRLHLGQLNGSNGIAEEQHFRILQAEISTYAFLKVILLVFQFMVTCGNTCLKKSGLLKNYCRANIVIMR